MVKTEEKYKEALLYMSMSDMITIYDLKDKNILFLFKDDDDKSNFDLSWLAESQNNEFKPMDLKSVDKGIISNIPTYLKENSSFDCIFVIKLGRMLNKIEIRDAMITLSKKGVIFHIDDCNLDKKGFEKYFFSKTSYISCPGKIYYWILKFFINPARLRKEDAFFAHPDWHNRTGVQLIVENVSEADVNMGQG
ncbi:MAG: hypothetical protein U9R34_06255 [Nanoarchaeota archaeon]|nr:hypothetical protein [Nanoarchaeota archaeon]